jgi:CubicO group peptidase (beta-lactamase class C family)
MKRMTKISRKAPSWGFITMASVLLVLMAPSGCATMGGASVEDAQGRFSFSLAEALEAVPTGGSYYHYYLPADDVHTFVVSESAATEDRALRQAFLTAGFDADGFGAAGSSSMGDWKLEKFLNADSGQEVAVAYQYRGDTVYAVMVTTENERIDPGSPPAEIMRIVTSMTFTEAAGEIFVPADFEELESFIQKTVERSGGSISIAALHEGEVIYTYAAGERFRGVPTDIGVAYNWGSITKLVTATALMQQVERGLVDLDAPVSRYVPELTLAEGVTLRNLLTHSSGLPDFEVRHLIGYDGVAAPDLETVLADYVARARELSFEPGSRSVYNNWNFLILGVIVQRITGTPLTRYAREHIFAPLAMNETAHFYRDLSVEDANPVIRADSKAAFVSIMESHGLDPEPLILEEDEEFLYLEHIDILPAWGGARSTARDAVRFGWAFVNNGEVDGARILNRKTVREMMTMQKSSDGTPLGIGLGWFLGRDEGGRYVEHSGGGFGINTLLQFYPGRKLVVAVLGNTNEYHAGQLLKYIVGLL